MKSLGGLADYPLVYRWKMINGTTCFDMIAGDARRPILLFLAKIGKKKFTFDTPEQNGGKHLKAECPYSASLRLSDDPFLNRINGNFDVDHDVGIFMKYKTTQHKMRQQTWLEPLLKLANHGSRLHNLTKALFHICK